MHQLELIVGKDWDSGKLVALRGKEAAQHRFILGVTGVGKSMLLVAIVLQLLNQGIPFCMLDPAGDLCDLILGALYDLRFFIDQRAFTRLRYLDMARADRFLPFNVLNQPFDSYSIAQFVLESWKRAWSAIAGGAAPVIENMVLAGVFVLAENGEPLTRLQSLLTDAMYRRQLLQRVSDPQIIDFFTQRFDALGRRANQLAESTLRRAFQFSFDPHLAFALGQRENSLKWRELMDSGASLLINLGGLEPEVQRFQGCLISVGIEQAALSRADLSEDARLPFHFIMDEFSQFAARSEVALERILSLTRKYGLSQTMATQYMGQVGNHLVGALQNTTLISFRVGADDAPYVVSRVGTVDPKRIKVSPRGNPSWMSAGEQKLELGQLLTTLPPRVAFLRLGDTTRRLQTLTVPRPICTHEELAQIKEEYAQRYLTPREDIERQVRKMGPSQSDPPTGSPPQRLGARRMTLLSEDDGETTDLQ
jgi:hypothetical protein